MRGLGFGKEMVTEMNLIAISVCETQTMREANGSGWVRIYFRFGTLRRLDC
jgi:hypothetical protein